MLHLPRRRRKLLTNTEIQIMGRVRMMQLIGRANTHVYHVRIGDELLVHMQTPHLS